MLEKVKSLTDDLIKDLDVYVVEVFTSTEEEKTILNIVLDSDNIIDLNKITEASRIINKVIDSSDLLDDIDELDIYSKEKGDNNE